MAQVQYTKVCPFVRPVSVQGGTFFTFSSAGEDFTLSMTEDNNKKFEFSKFALLKIPTLSTSSDKKAENLVRLTAIPGAYKQMHDRGIAAVNLNTNFAESFQNYCLNLETLILSKSTYDESLPQTVSERVFFKWMKELGAMRFTQSYDNSNWSNPLFTEEVDSVNYNRVVQYIGNIDITNSFRGAVNSYNEVYANIPTEAGNFPQVYFKSVSDDNYYPGMGICRLDDGDVYDIDNGFIAGRKYNDVHPISNFDTHAYYDNPFALVANTDVISNSLQLRKAPSTIANPTKVSDFTNGAWWYAPTPNLFCYYTEPVSFTDATNDYLALGDPTTIISDGLETYTVFKRNKLDGITIEMDPTAYANLDVDIDNLNDVARSVASQSFEFNAVLFYYNVYEDLICAETYQDGEYFDAEALENELTSSGVVNARATTKNILATNLFGVLFLDNVNTSVNQTLDLSSIITSLGTGEIPSMEKCIPNKETKLNGNSYGITLNIKLDVSAVNSGVEVESVIDKNSTFSLEVFIDALNQMRNTSDLVVGFYDYFRGVDERLRRIEEASASSTANSFLALAERLKQVEASITNTDLLLQSSDKSDLVDLIQLNYDMLNNLLTNNTDINVAFDLGGIKAGPGIVLTRGANNVQIKSSEVNFNFGEKYIIYPPNEATKPLERWLKKTRNLHGVSSSYYEFEMDLRELNNYIRIQNDGAAFKPDGDFYLKLKDDSQSWNTGQTLRIYFENAYEMYSNQHNYDFYIKTDYHNIKKATTNYNVSMAKITANDFRIRDNRPIIEIHCIDGESLDFIVDFLN